MEPALSSQAARADLTAARKLIANDPAAAAKAFAALCARWPEMAAPLIGLADVQSALGAAAAAERLLDMALALEPNNLHALNNQAIVYQGANRLDEALTLLQRADAIQPFHPLISTNLVAMLRMQFRHDDAIAYAAAWTQAHPEAPAAWQAYCESTSGRRYGAAAVAAARRLHALRPDGPSSALLALALDAHAEYAAGLKVAQTALATAADDLDARAALVHLLTSLGRTDEARAELAALKTAGPGRDRRGLEARVELLAGPTLAGWRAYEHRFETTQVQLPSFAKPRWTGGAIAGKRIVLVDEQGYGDKIQFARAAWDIVARGGEAILYLVPQLAPLFTQLPSGIRFTSTISDSDFDAWTPLMSAPLALENPWAGPNTPYLHPPSQRQAPAPLLAPARGMRIGVAWAGSPLHHQDGLRSSGLAALVPLLGIPDTEYFSLQHGHHSSDIATLKAQALLTDLAPHIADWGDTAAAIAALDLVITVDTAVAHLAGAMGKEVWNMVQFAPDWRWGASGQTTPWYPSMRLYRQTKPKCWRDPIAAISSDLETRLQEGRQPAAAA